LEHIQSILAREGKKLRFYRKDAKAKADNLKTCVMPNFGVTQNSGFLSILPNT
jgi:hypothetical protein